MLLDKDDESNSEPQTVQNRICTLVFFLLTTTWPGGWNSLQIYNNTDSVLSVHI